MYIDLYICGVKLFFPNEVVSICWLLCTNAASLQCHNPNFESCVYVLFMTIVYYSVSYSLLCPAFTGPESFDILRGHSRATMFLICNNAAQGILSSFFFKYAGKGKYTQISLLSWLFFQPFIFFIDCSLTSYFWMIY